MIPWILGGLIGAAVTAVVFYNEEEKEKEQIAKEDAEVQKTETNMVPNFLISN